MINRTFRHSSIFIQMLMMSKDRGQATDATHRRRETTNTTPSHGSEVSTNKKSTKRRAAFFPGKSQFRNENRASSGTFHGHVTHSSVFPAKNEEDGRVGRTWLHDPLPSHGAHKKPNGLTRTDNQQTNNQSKARELLDTTQTTHQHVDRFAH
jgi:hypothetical protein